MPFEYKWKTTRIKIKAEVAAKELEKIKSKYGDVKADYVVNDAKKMNHPFHNYFIWDDTEAAKQHRLWQARHLIGQLVVVRIDDVSQEEISTRAYVNMQTDNDENQEKCYVNIIDGMSDPVMRQRILADAMRELANFRRKYADLKEFAALFAEMDKIAI